MGKGNSKGPELVAPDLDTARKRVHKVEGTNSPIPKGKRSGYGILCPCAHRLTIFFILKRGSAAVSANEKGRNNTGMELPALLRP